MVHPVIHLSFSITVKPWDVFLPGARYHKWINSKGMLSEESIEFFFFFLSSGKMFLNGREMGANKSQPSPSAKTIKWTIHSVWVRFHLMVFIDLCRAFISHSLFNPACLLPCELWKWDASYLSLQLQINIAFPITLLYNDLMMMVNSGQVV